MKNFLMILLSSIIFWSCNNTRESNAPTAQKGEYNKTYVKQLTGFAEARDGILSSQNMFLRDFIVWSTDSSWALPAEHQLALKNVRNAINKPNAKTLLQKVIDLEAVSDYMNNIYGGTVGGFVSVAADMKSISTMSDTYWGLRLDYKGTKFRADGAGYAVIRFYSNSADRLTIPYCAELGGDYPHDWPNGGGGFTTSKLGQGGYPEWKTIGYDAPQAGAELYEVTPEGREILRSIFKDGRWQTFEDESLPVAAPAKGPQIRSGVYATTNGESQYVMTVCTYMGRQFTVRGFVDGKYHLTTDKLYPGIDMEVVEKGIYGVEVYESEISNLCEINL